MFFERLTPEMYEKAREKFKTMISRDLEKDGLNLDDSLSEEKKNFLNNASLQISCERWQSFYQLLVDVHHKKFDEALGFQITTKNILELDSEDFNTLMSSYNFKTPHALETLAKARPEPELGSESLLQFMTRFSGIS